MSNVEEKLLDHSYDGIQEFDNPLPPWWVGLFLFTIAWSFVYIIYYHVVGGPNQLDELAAEYEQFEANRPAQPADDFDLAGVLVPLTEEDALTAGQKTYTNNCASCHGMAGEGGIGPAFADNYWIHGGDMQNIIRIISVGVPEKGMIAWKGILKSKDIANVASYLKGFEGTNPPNLKAPEGTLYTPEDAPKEVVPEGEQAAADDGNNQN